MNATTTKSASGVTLVNAVVGLIAAAFAARGYTIPNDVLIDGLTIGNAIALYLIHRDPALAAVVDSEPKP